MTSLSAHQLQDAVIINHVHLRAPSHLQSLCQQQLLNINDISQVVGATAGEYVFFRQVRVKKKLPDFSKGFVSSLHKLCENIVDGNSLQAEYSQAVQFNNMGELLALLSFNIQSGQGCHWFFETWQSLFELPKAEALSRLWVDHKTDLADMIVTLAQQNKLTSFWLSLSSRQSDIILNALTRSLGINNTGKPEVFVEELKVISPRYLLNESAFSLWQPVFENLKTPDSRLQLSVVFMLLRWRADLLCKPDAIQIINHIARFVHHKKNNAIKPETVNQHNAIVKNAGKEKTAEKPETKKYRSEKINNEYPEIIKLQQTNNVDRKPRKKAHTEERILKPVQANNDLKLYAKDKNNKNEKNSHLIKLHLPSDNTAKKQQSNINQSIHINSPELVDNDEHNNSKYFADAGTVYCQQGGLFYLLNFMSRKPVQRLLERDNVFASTGGAWGCLYRMADLLERQDEATLDLFIACQMGLNNTEQLKQIPRLQHAAEYQKLAVSFYSTKVWNSSLLKIPAQVEYSASHLDIHYPIQQAKLEVRKAALDLDPGWLPWLGQVVSFHYHSNFLQDE